MKFSDIPGREDVKKELRSSVDNGRVPHAILLSGPAGVGKMMLARAFITYAHCSSPVDGEPCGHCRNCRLHQEMAHPDVHYSFPYVKKEKKIKVCDDLKESWLRMLTEAPAMPPERWLEIIEAGNSKPSIYVDEAAEIIHSASYPPYASKIKFFVIWLPERMGIEAANKLLKVIEEPAPGICFILVSDNELEVLPTIYSRTRPIHVGTVERADMERYMRTHWGLDEALAFKLAPLAAGSLAKADELGSHSGENEEFRNLSQTLMRDAYSRKVSAMKRIAEEMTSFGREKIIRFLRYLATMVRENFIYNMKMPQLSCLTPEEEAFSRNFSPFVNAGNVEDIISEIDRARLHIERNCSPRLVLFDFFLLLIPLIRRKPEY